MKLLTFLGTGKYELTTYAWQGQEHTARFAPAAASRFLGADVLVVFVTEEAQQAVLPELRAELPAGLEIQAAPVPRGEDDRDLWQIFEQVSRCVEPGEEVGFDITHGLRSFPLVGLLAAAFLRSALGVRVNAVLYGAYDVRDRTVTPSRTPMFDLTPMLDLLEWASAADRFNLTGDARYLASLLREQQKAMALSAGGRAALQDAGHLGRLADALTELSQALRLIRPYQAMGQVGALGELVAQARPALSQLAAARPFALLLETVANTYAPLGPADAGAASAWESLARQRAMLHWYVEREQWVQAATLAREWLISWVMARLGVTDVIQREERERVTHVIGAEADDLNRSYQAGRAFRPLFLQGIPRLEEVLSVWGTLAKVRNDIDHAGMRQGAEPPDTLIRQVRDCVEKLGQLPLQPKEGPP